jgi:uncharacterized protein (TIGR03382 family)
MGFMAWLAGVAEAATGEPLTLSWAVSGDQSAGYFGASVSSAGDVNGDGFDDVIVGAWQANDGEVFEGVAYVFLGSSTGLAPVPSWTADADETYANFGFSVAAAGDVNGDGFDDVIVGAPVEDDLVTDEGQAHVYLGSATGLATLPVWSAGSLQGGAGFGTSVACAGDVDGDGFDDVIVGAPGYDGGDDAEGRAYVFMGSPTGPEAVASWTAESDEVSAFFGTSVASAGDINDDGYDDVIVGAYASVSGPDEGGLASMFLGSPSGLDDDPLWEVDADQDNAGFGSAVAPAGDVNDDGFGDVIVGAPSYDDPEIDEGQAFAYHGSAWGLGGSSAWTADSDQDGASFGTSVASAGDVNGDGYDDVIVGAPTYDGGVDDEGRVEVYLGSESGLETTPLFTVEGEQGGARLGGSVASAGDVNGDGYDDVIAGAFQYDDKYDDVGKAFVYLGGPTGTAEDDADGDGSPRPFDCDDGDATVYPGAPELCDGKDNACAGLPDEDADLDGDGTATCAGDCDDDNAGIHPLADEVCDGADSNCDTVVDADDVDADGDAWPACLGDCDDADPSVSPGAAEECDGAVDNNCDGAVDEECDEGNCSCGGSGVAGALPSLLVALLATRRRRYKTSAA